MDGSVDPMMICAGQLCGGLAGIKCDCICEDVGTAPICVDSYYDPNGNDGDECDPDAGDVNCKGYCICDSSKHT